MKTVGNLIDSISGILTGTNLDNVTNLYGALERAARRTIQKADIPETIAQTALTLYDGVTDYSCPSSLYNANIYDLRVQGNSRYPQEYVGKEMLADFDRTKGYGTTGYRVTVEYVNGSPVLSVLLGRANHRIVIDSMTETTGWTASGDASGRASDTTVYWDAPSSLRFNLAASGSQGLLTKTTSSVDLTNYVGVGVVFLAVRIPSAANLTSIALRLGSDASNYYEVTATTGFIKSFTSNQWMLVSFDLSQATTTGTPTITAIDYTRLAFNYDGTAMTNFYVGSLFTSLPSPHTLFYGTNAIFQKASDSSLNTTISLDTDTILLGDAAYTLLEYEGAMEVAQQMGGKLSSPTVQILGKMLDDPNQGLYASYRAQNPSQKLTTTSSYYD